MTEPAAHEPPDTPLRGARTGRLLALAGALLAVALLIPTSEPLLEAGTPAPPLRRRTLEGGSVDFSAQQLRPTLVNFFATWCVPCRQEIPRLNHAHEMLKERVNIVGVAVFHDGAANLPGMVKSMGIVYPVWVSDDDSAARWRVAAVPTSYLVDPKGIIQWTAAGLFEEADLLAALQRMGR
jgi:thiol-disulfide isomerase/thioredoxin